MNAPVAILAAEAEAVTPVTLGVELYGIAMRREVTLSDAEGCGDALLHAHPGLDLRDRAAARRVAIDLAAEAEAVTPVTLGVELYGIAMRREVTLSDAEGCGDALLHAHPGLDLRDRAAARRVAIDLAQHAARHPNTALVTAYRSAVAMAEDVAEGATDADLHAVLAQIADLLDGALSLTSD